MKRILFFLFLIGAAMTAQAQTADEILAKSFEALGGVDKWKTLKTTKMEGNMSMQGFEFPGTIFAATPNRQRVEVSVQGNSIVQAFDGQNAWWINPFSGSTEAQLMPDEMAASLKDFQFQNELIDYAAKGHAVALEGKETVEGAETFKLKLTKKNGDVEYHFIDSETYAPIMIRTTAKAGPTKGQVAETFMSDYQEVNGMMFPFFMETKAGGQSLQKITIKSIKLDEAYEDSLFLFPKK